MGISGSWDYNVKRRVDSAFGLSEGKHVKGCVSHDERGGGMLKGALMAEDQSIVDRVMRRLAA